MTESTGSIEVSSLQHPQPLMSLVASAKRLTGKTMSRGGQNAKGWQEDAWDMYDLVGEQRFLASTLANRLAQARFYVGRLNADPTEPPEPVQDTAISDILGAVGGSASGLAQMVQRVGVNLFVAGECWLAGIPREVFPASLLSPPTLSTAVEVAPSQGEAVINAPVGTLAIDDLEWRALSVSEVRSTGGGEVTLLLGEDESEKIVCHPEDIFLIRVWRPHPRKWWEGDSPTRSSLPVLRELVGLTMHIGAQVDSRLAGAGLLIVPASAKRALNVAAGVEEDSEEDPFTEALMEAMITPISDRANASALVPLVVTVPDEVTDKFQYLTFAKPLDSEARSLRDEAIRRLALGQDAPPELLLGTAGMNHWGAWLVREDVVTTHIEPPLALICDAITTQYLWPVLADTGMDEATAHDYVVWYDVDHMITRPNRSTDALTLFDKGAISDVAVRDATGFSEADAPANDPDPTADLEPAIQMAVDAAERNPGLYEKPGLLQLTAQFRALLAGDIPDLEEPQPVPPALAEAQAQAEETGPPAPTPPAAPGAPPPTAEASPPAEIAASGYDETSIGRIALQPGEIGTVATIDTTELIRHRVEVAP